MGPQRDRPRGLDRTCAGPSDRVPRVSVGRGPRSWGNTMDQDALVGALLIFGLMAALVLALLDARSKRKEAQRQTAANFEVEVTKAVRGDRVEAYRALWKVIEPLSIEWTFDNPPVPSKMLCASSSALVLPGGRHLSDARLPGNLLGNPERIEGGEGNCRLHVEPSTSRRNSEGRVVRGGAAQYPRAPPRTRVSWPSGPGGSARRNTRSWIRPGLDIGLAVSWPS